jgi:hypothetical protein
MNLEGDRNSLRSVLIIIELRNQISKSAFRVFAEFLPDSVVIKSLEAQWEI